MERRQEGEWGILKEEDGKENEKDYNKRKDARQRVEKNRTKRMERMQKRETQKRKED